ncbi:MAG: DUF554 domain-containing protein [Marinifilaceae bacterium]|jgi:uncharacterized membrane protein YqgA involved in biofilm formation
MTGTLINVGAVMIGSTVGLVFRSRIPDRLFKIVFQAIGLFTIYLGVNMAFQAKELLLMVFSLVVGGFTGEALRIESRVEKLSDRLKQKFGKGDEKFTPGLVTAFLLFCMGSMSILGCFEEGMGKEPNLLLTKSVMDGFSSVALAAALGIGVLFSVVPLLIYQGGLTLLAALFGDVVPVEVINEITGVGGILILGLGISLLELKRIKVLNLLPALVVEVILCYIFL